MKNRVAKTDICYLFEDKPDVGRSGDSVFIRQIAKGFPQYKFHIARITSSAEEFLFPESDTLPNLSGYQLINLSHHGAKGRGKSSVSYRKASAFFQSVARCIESGQLGPGQMNNLLSSAADLAPWVKFDAIWKNPTSWDLIKAVFGVVGGEITFVEHRELLYEVIGPIWQLISKWQELPQAKVYQADSGIRPALLAMVAAHQHRGKFVMVDDCLSHNALERERLSIKLREGGAWRPDYEAFQRARNSWVRRIRDHCLAEADEILANTFSSARKIRETIGGQRPIRVVREGIEGETARRWGAYYSTENEELAYRVTFLTGFYSEKLARSITSVMQRVENNIGPGKFVILSLSSVSREDLANFDRVVKPHVTSTVRLTSEFEMITEIAKATVVAVPSQIHVGDRPIINSLHAGKPVVVSMIDGDSIFADPRLSVETDCFVNPNRLEGREFPNAIASLIKRRDHLQFHPRRLGEALFNHREIMEGYAKVYQLVSTVP